MLRPGIGTGPGFPADNSKPRFFLPGPERLRVNPAISDPGPRMFLAIFIILSATRFGFNFQSAFLEGNIDADTVVLYWGYSKFLKINQVLES